MEDKKRINPNKRAIAVKYDINEPAPKVLASGKGYVAQKILEKAKDENIPVFEDAKLVQELEKIDLGQYIPSELYEAVARVLVFITDLDKRYDKYGK